MCRELEAIYSVTELQDTAETQAAQHELLTAAGDKAAETEGLVNAYGSSCTRQGFELGFRAALRLLIPQ